MKVKIKLLFFSELFMQFVSLLNLFYTFILQTFKLNALLVTNLAMANVSIKMSVYLAFMLVMAMQHVLIRMEATSVLVMKVFLATAVCALTSTNVS